MQTPLFLPGYAVDSMFNLGLLFDSVLLFCALHQSPRSISGLKMQADDPLKLFVGGLPWALTSDDLREVRSLSRIFACIILTNSSVP